jgi:hypothetical protein
MSRKNTLSEKIVHFKTNGLFTEVYDKQDYWSCVNKSKAELQSKLAELTQIKAKWARPGNDIDTYQTWINDHNSIVDQICANYESACTAHKRATAIENSQTYLNRYIEKFEACIAQHDGNEQVENYGRGMTRPSFSKENGYSVNNEIAQQNAQSKAYVDRLNRTFDSFKTSIADAFDNRPDRTGEAIIPDNSARAKRVIADWEVFHQQEQENRKAWEEQRLENFKEFFKSDVNQEIIGNAAKEYVYGNCPNERCIDGYIHERRITACHEACGGKGYVRYGTYVPIGATRQPHPNDGKKICGQCEGVGFLDEVGNTREKCDRCHGLSDKAFIYTGTDIPETLANDIATFLPNDIARMITLKEYFKANPDEKYYYKLYDDGEKYTGILFWDRNLNIVEPEDMKERIDEIFARLEERSKMRKSDYVKGSDSLFLGLQYGMKTSIINQNEKEIIDFGQIIDSARVNLPVNKLMVYYTYKNMRDKSEELWTQVYDLNTNEKQFKGEGYYDFVMEGTNTYGWSYKRSLEKQKLGEYGYKTLLDKSGQTLTWHETDRGKSIYCDSWKMTDGLPYIIITLNDDNGKVIYDQNLQPVFKKPYEDYGDLTIIDFQNGFIPAMRKGKWGFINLNGKKAIPFKYGPPTGQDKIVGFRNGLTKVSYKGEDMTINTAGKKIE